MRLVLDEARKHRAFREAWVCESLGGLFLALMLVMDDSIIPAAPPHQNWYMVQQSVRTYGASLTAFLLTVGLPGLVCCESAYRTDAVNAAAARGRFLTWRSKALYTVLYCAAVVGTTGAASLAASCARFGFAEAFGPMEHCAYFLDTALPPVSNLAYCVLQYGFLFLGALYFAGFVLLAAALTRRTALTVVLCGASYVAAACVCYDVLGLRRTPYLRGLLEVLYRFGVGGYLLQESYSWTSYGQPGAWSDVWKPVLLAAGMTVLEFAALWLLWRRKEKA